MKNELIVCGTGHRPNKLGGYGKKAFSKLVSIAEEWLKENNPTKVISGMALGWDMALGQAAINCNIPFIAAVPFKGQEKMWPEESQRYYNYLLTKAEEIIYVCDEGFTPLKMQKRNAWMVNNSNLVLAMWDGSAGGTNNCLNYAKTKENIIIVNLYEKWKIN